VTCAKYVSHLDAMVKHIRYIMVADGVQLKRWLSTIWLY